MKSVSPVSAGKPIPGTRLRVVDPESYQEVADGQQGVILAQGPGVMKGYYNDPQGTQKAFQDGDWFDTGDLGWRAPGMIMHCYHVATVPFAIMSSLYHLLSMLLTSACLQIPLSLCPSVQFLFMHSTDSLLTKSLTQTLAPCLDSANMDSNVSPTDAPQGYS